MSQNLRRRVPQRTGITSPWIKYVALGAVILLIIAVSLYAFRYMSLDREFHHNIKTFGEDTYKEIFSLQDTKSKAEPILAFAEEAFSFVGPESEAAARFGLLARYSCTEPRATAEAHCLDYILSNIEDNTGYIWVAYCRSALDPGGEAISASGTENHRILSRWTVERHGTDSWIVTQIWESP